MKQCMTWRVPCAVVLVIHGLVNSFSTRILAYMSTFSAGWHFVGAPLSSLMLTSWCCWRLVT